MREIISRIEQDVWKSIPSEERIGVLNGLSGTALFYHHLYNVYKEEEYNDKFLEVISRINQLVSEKAYQTTLCSGLAGYAWMLLNVKGDALEIEETYLSSLDELLKEGVNESTGNDNYDFLHGALGIIYYFSLRYKQTASPAIKNILNEFLIVITSKIRKDVSSVVINKSEDTCLYFGLAHGIAGVINTLVAVQMALDLPKENYADSMWILVNLLEEHKSYDAESKQFFANYYDISLKKPVQSRLSWCQGDLGIGNALYNVGKYFDDVTLQEKGSSLLVATKDIELNRSGVNDYGICHGSAGIILQYCLLDRKTESNSENAIRYWTQILEEQTSDYKVFKSFYENNYVAETNILQGSAGLGLVLLSQHGLINMDWLECLNLH